MLPLGIGNSAMIAWAPLPSGITPVMTAFLAVECGQHATTRAPTVATWADRFSRRSRNFSLVH